MKKTFELIHPKIKYPRMVEGVKHDIRKYLKRERRIELPDGAKFWDFDCKFGDTEADAKPIHLAELDECINDAGKRELKTFYVEILAKPGFRTKKPQEGDAVEPYKPAIPKIKKFGEG